MKGYRNSSGGMVRLASGGAQANNTRPCCCGGGCANDTGCSGVFTICTGARYFPLRIQISGTASGSATETLTAGGIEEVLSATSSGSISFSIDITIPYFGGPEPVDFSFTWASFNDLVSSFSYDPFPAYVTIAGSVSGSYTAPSVGAINNVTKTLESTSLTVGGTVNTDGTYTAGVTFGYSEVWETDYLNASSDIVNVSYSVGTELAYSGTVDTGDICSGETVSLTSDDVSGPADGIAFTLPVAPSPEILTSSYSGSASASIDVTKLPDELEDEEINCLKCSPAYVITGAYTVPIGKYITFSARVVSAGLEECGTAPCAWSGPGTLNLMNVDHVTVFASTTGTFNISYEGGVGLLTAASDNTALVPNLSVAFANPGQCLDPGDIAVSTFEYITASVSPPEEGDPTNVCELKWDTGAEVDGAGNDRRTEVEDANESGTYMPAVVASNMFISTYYATPRDGAAWVGIDSAGSAYTGLRNFRTWVYLLTPRDLECQISSDNQCVSVASNGVVVATNATPNDTTSYSAKHDVLIPVAELVEGWNEITFTIQDDGEVAAFLLEWALP